MTDKFLDVLSKGITMRQRDFVKSFVVVFPLVYCGFDLCNPNFIHTDVITRCMYTTSGCILLNSLSLVFLWLIHWLTRCPTWSGVFYFIGPAVFTALNINGSVFCAEGDFTSLPKCIIEHYAIFFSPFLLYALCLSIYYRFTHKPDNRPNSIAPDNADKDAEEQP